MTRPDLATIGSMFSGIDGLALGVQMQTLACIAWHAETDPDASRVLASHWHAPNLGDVSRINWNRVEPVDILVGGFPCQDISLAGKGAGIDGERSGLWRYMVAAIRALRPRYVFVENVAALLARGFERVAADLAESGYRFAWSGYSSAAVGAPHRRERMFILATADTAFAGLERPDERRSKHAYDAGRGDVADTAGKRRKSEGQQQRKRAVDAQAGADVAPADRSGFERVTEGDLSARRDDRSSGHDADGRSTDGQPRGGVGHDTGAIPRGVPEVGRRAGARTAASQHLNPAFVEWMMGFPDGWTAMVPRRARLRLLGNAVQPQVAMAAWDGLMRRLEEVSR